MPDHVEHSSLYNAPQGLPPEKLRALVTREMFRLTHGLGLEVPDEEIDRRIEEALGKLMKRRQRGNVPVD